MAKDPNTTVSMTEFLDSLERGRRTYEGFKYAIEIGQRLANYEQVERELMDRVELAKAAASKAEQDSAGAIAQAEQATVNAQVNAKTAVYAAQQREAEKIDALRRSTQEQADGFKDELAALAERVAEKRVELDGLTTQTVEASNEIRKIQKQLENVREAKRAILEA